ncbi:unnamed protein product [Pseudo-nitzschia multistriata]|uniref:Uncharacterized protein n=1 Tax=Pseudo-nitzschia multistriata TaxID=183589 RepID=A0A448ZE62_9STRA|nr:unnamed protein product [Pseudo-nitzschia multistriata]
MGGYGKKNKNNGVDASFDSSIATNSTRKSKNGMKKLGSSIKNVFGGKKRRRRKKLAALQREGNANGNVHVFDDRSYVSYEYSEAGDSDVYSYQEEMASVHSRKRSGNSPGRPLTKIHEGDNEDASDVEDTASPRRNRGSRGRRGGDDASVSSKSSWMSNRRTKKAQQQTPDPLLLVVLLVDPSTLRFELLSLEFDLAETAKQARKNRNTHGSHEFNLTVQDVLNQITPDALTEEKLRASASSSGGCRALIDRNGQIHFGTASLETACAARSLRASDRATQLREITRAKRNRASGAQAPVMWECRLGNPTYTGEPHRDVLLGFFVSSEDDCDGGKKNGKSITEMATDVARVMDLARPIFADPSVVDLMEGNGYDLTGWKSGRLTDKSGTSPASRAMLMPPTPSKRRSRRLDWNHPVVKLLVALVSMTLATVLAFALVSVGLHLVPALSPGDIGDQDNHGHGHEDDGRHTFEGYARLAFDAVRAAVTGPGDSVEA